jgi:hypothetical protein
MRTPIAATIRLTTGSNHGSPRMSPGKYPVTWYLRLRKADAIMATPPKMMNASVRGGSLCELMTQDALGAQRVCALWPSGSTPAPDSFWRPELSAARSSSAWERLGLLRAGGRPEDCNEQEDREHEEEPEALPDDLSERHALAISVDDGGPDKSKGEAREDGQRAKKK